MTAGVEGLAAWPPAAMATVVAAALAVGLTAVDQACDGDVGRNEIGFASADTMYDMQILRESDAVLGTMVLGLITGRGSG